MSIKIKYKQILKVSLIIILMPIYLLIIRIYLNSLVNLGTYFGTFLRYLYKIVVK